MEAILAFSVKEQKKIQMVSKIEFRQSPNGSYMIKGKNAEDGTLTTMMSKVNAQEYIEAIKQGLFAGSVVEEFTY